MLLPARAVSCLGLLLLILLGGCTVDRVISTGRPCSAEAPCGPDTVCGPAGRCIPSGQVADGAMDGPGLGDAPWHDGPRADAPMAPDATLVDVGQDVLPEAATPNDKDADKIPDAQDNCIYKPNPDQKDGDKDKVGDVCDNCVTMFNQGQVDVDNDGVGNVCDNCPLKANQDQKNLDSDAHGDVCDSDRDGDGVPNDIDPSPDVKDTVLYFKQPPDASDLEDVGGTWTSQGSAYCQTQNSNLPVFPYRARLKPALLSAADVLVQARFTVKSTGSSSSYWPGAGMVVRAGSVIMGNFDAYACLIDLKDMRLVLGRYSSSTWSTLKSGNNNSVSGAGPYTMRMTVKGSAINCELVPGGPSINASHSQHNSGTVGFITFRAATCYDYLLVLPAP